MTSTVNPNLVTSIAVSIKEYGVGVNRVETFRMTITFADGRSVVRQDLSRKIVVSSLTKFGASPEMTRNVVSRSGKLHRDPQTMEVTVDSSTLSNWNKAR
jgi:hypothetical protein